MPRHTTVLNPPSVPAADISLREFVVDEDAEHFNTALWRTIDQNAFILAQRDALEAFNVAKALRLSEETAAVERERRNAALPSSTPPSSRHQSQPIAIKKISATPSLQHPPQYSTPSDDPIARSLPRSSHTHADVYQVVNENRSSPSSSTSPIKSIKTSSQSSSYHYQDKKAPASIAKQHSRNQLSLSTSSFHTSPSSTAVDSRHSRSTSQSNTFTKVPSLVLPSIPPAGDQRAFSRRNPGVTIESTPSSSQSMVVAPPLSAPQKSSTFSRNLRPGTVIPSIQDTSSSSASTPEGSKSAPPKPAPAPKRFTGPKPKAHLQNPFSDLQICPQCGNRLTIPLIQVNNFVFLFSFFLLILFSFFFYILFLHGSLGFPSHSVFGSLLLSFSDYSFLHLLILVRSAMPSIPRVLLARRDIVGDVLPSLRVHVHALQARAPLVVQFGTAATTSVPWLYLKLSMSLITSLLLKLASLLLLLLLPMELILILTAVFSLGDSRERLISNF